MIKLLYKKTTDKDKLLWKYNRTAIPLIKDS